MLFDTDISLASDNIKSINFLLSGFDVDPADGINSIHTVNPNNDIGLTNNICSANGVSSKNNILETIDLETISLEKSQITGLDSRKSAIDIITQTVPFGLGLNKTVAF